MSSLAKWSVVSTVRAPKAYVNRFIEHYLDAGADRIFLFFDDPDTMENRRWFGRPRIVGIECNQQYWDAIREVRAPNIEFRQQTNLRSAILINRAEWLLHVDSDEFVCAQRPIGEILQEQKPDTFAVITPAVEAIYDQDPKPNNVFDTPWFKRYLGKDEDQSVIPKLYGDLAPTSRSGFFAHWGGKSFFRTKYAIRRYGLHIPVPIDTGLRCDVVSPEMQLLHFQSLTFADWKEKWLRLISGTSVASDMSGRRREQLNMIRNAHENAGDVGLLELYRRMNVFNADRLALARSAGFVVKRLDLTLNRR